MNQTTQNIHNTVLWTALVTPMHEDGSVDFDSLVSLAKRQANAGNGITLLGSTGEGLALNASEQFAIVECVTKLALDVPIMVAVGGYNLAAQQAWISQCDQLGVDAYLIASPIYAKPGVQGLTHWFQTLLSQANAPCMIYNVPSRSGVNIPVAAIQNIQDHPNCWAIKEASGDLNTILNFRQHCPKVALYSGEDAMMPYLAGADVQGLVSVAGNVWPKATNRYVKQALAGEHKGLFPLWHNAVAALFQVASPIATKVLMAEKGLLISPKLREPLTEKELSTSQQLTEIDQQINQWLTQSQPSEANNIQQIIGVK
ncbi:4-hydroxy-tetrahydrodipicolinate synthase [Thalassotalea sp. G2M2-11]|uniref:4-hydroxy-tetrahydrodipicolinate synthase n=1 Tax=Thalassotalea sp. G2M2-11 TaxID=2787627 RepID=UPI0019D2F8C3|nr:4-hydroxy-tetrahydrodipicolinate synthase [Thalassotalea sp. G2M2-11]